MTKRYKQMSVGDALYTAARRYPGSVEALAARMGRSANVMRSKLQTDTDTHHITLEEALQIIELLDVTVPTAADMAVKAIAWRLGRVMVRHIGVDSVFAPLETQGLALQGLLGLLSANLAVATQSALDRELTDREADVLHADIARCVEALFVLKDAVEQRTAEKS